MSTLPATPLLRPGDSGDSVLAAGRAYRKLLGDKAQNLTTGFYGVGLQDDVTLAERMHGLKVDTFIGPSDWALLEPHVDAYGRWLLAHDDPIARNREALMRSCDWALAHATHWVYQQKRPMGSSMRLEFSMDCSETATLLYKDAGLTDPNGREYDGFGNTDTLLGHGPQVAAKNRKPGALVFYANPSHVTICLRDVTRVLSFGHTPLGEYDWNYRDVIAVTQPSLRTR